MERLGGAAARQAWVAERPSRHAQCRNLSELSRPSAFVVARLAAAVESSRRSSGQPAGKLRWVPAAKASEAKNGDGYAAMRVANYMIDCFPVFLSMMLSLTNMPPAKIHYGKKEREKLFINVNE